ncbi:MAG TPA: MFS transporter [Solirubrobacterales bacterium]|nr:MFS transporter [Solirubrobacterales bacterium]
MSSTDDNNIALPQDRQHYGITFAVLALAGASYALLQSAVAPALPAIQHDLHASATATAWLLTGYLLSASVLTPIVGRLGDMFGKEHTLVVALVVLALGTLLAAAANSIGMLILARVIQGSGGAIFPLAFGIIRDEFPREKAAQGIALISAILGIGGGLGIILSGPIVSTLGYHWLFWLPLVAVVIATLATVFFIPESPVKSPGRVDWAGSLLLSAWLVLLLLGITQTGQWGWGDPRVIGLIVAALAVLAAWIRFESRALEPLVDMGMMRIRGVWTVNAAAFLVGAGMYSSFILFPEFTEAAKSTGYGFGASVTEAGLFLLPCTLMMLVVSPIAGWLAVRVGSRITLIAGSLASALAFALITVRHDAPADVYISTAILGAGIGLAFASLANLIIEAVPPEQTSVATGVNTVMRTLGGAVGGQLGASLIAGTATAAGVATNHGFTLAFLLATCACLLAALASLAVPRRPRRPPPAIATTLAPAGAIGATGAAVES